MDVQATTSHEIVQVENQPAVDALRRLIKTRDDLTRMMAAQPSLTEANTLGAQHVIDALPGFWASPESIGGAPRSALLGQHLASVMKEAATLRSLDGTLSDNAARLAASVASAGMGGSLPTHVHARELLLGGVPHAGSLIVVDEGKLDLALLFTPHGGWEAFDSTERLLESARRRLLESPGAAEATGLDEDEFAEAKTQGTVGSREIAGPLFAALAHRMIDVQLARITLAADDHRLDGDEPHAAIRLADRVRHELSAGSLLDIAAIENLREAYLLEAAVGTRLAGVPTKVRDDWYEARDAYNETLSVAAIFRAAAGAKSPLTLHAFASQELAVKLAALGIEEAPETITVEIGRVAVLPAPLASLDPLPGPTASRRMSLVDFACQNIGRFSLETLHAVDAGGASLRGRLNHGALRSLVRELDIASRYQAHVEERLREGSVGALARKLTMAVQGARMRMEAAEARLSYYLPDEPRSFLDDRDERGFRWVEAALDKPVRQRRVGAHEIVVSQLMYRQAPLDGILVFTARATNSVPRMVVYTPGAPDGIAFREFESRQDAAKQLLHHPAFREYLLDRLPAEFATVSANGVSRRFAGDQLAHWVLGASGDASYTPTAEPFTEREVLGDFLAASYDATVEKYRRDTRFLATSTSDADSDALLAYLQGRFTGNSAASLAAAALTEIPASLARVTQASWRFYDHVKAGDTGEAVVAFVDGYVNALNLVGPPFMGGRHIAAAIVRSRTGIRGVASAGLAVTAHHARFDDRYAARHLRTAGRVDDEGIFRVRDQAYVEQDGTFFLVRFDDDYARWRLAPSRGAIDARFTGPVIERIDGRWTYAHDVGLRGGMRRLRQRLNRLVVRDDAPLPDAPGAAAPPAGPAVAPTVPPRPPALVLPRAMEPYRAEITATLVDNPSARVLIRSDGSHLKFEVPPRSALILEPLLHADIAGLSAHQRRIFLHEIDARFPLVSERASVMDVRGFAQQNGRRVSSPPHSPGLAQGADIQSPGISSSTGDPMPPAPALTPSQQQRWDDALAVARDAPRSPRRSSASSDDDAMETLAPTEAVPPDEWPRHVWYFSDHPFRAQPMPGPYRDGVALGDDSGWFDRASGLRSHPISALPPETPVNRLSEVVGTSPVQQSGQRDPLAFAIHIDMARLRNSDEAGRAVLGTPGFELRRRVLPNGEYQYTLQSRGPVYIPSNYIISVERRGEQPTRLTSFRP